MSMYPSLEDMKVDQMAKVQQQVTDNIMATAVSQLPYPSQGSHGLPYPLHPQQSAGVAYPALGEYMGLEFTDEIIALNMPEYLPPQQTSQQVAVPNAYPTQSLGLVAPVTGDQLSAVCKVTPSNAVRQLLLCKNNEGKIGMRVKDINKGVFVCLVQKDSPAAMAGLRFGDQILEINGTTVAGFSTDKVHSLLKKCPPNGINVAVRDRPFERAITLHKDSTGHIGFQFKDGEIMAIVKDSSAARNGLLTQHHMLEINGQNVVGLKDKEVTSIVQNCGSALTVTVMPSFLYQHMMKHMASSLTKIMDHSMPLL